MSDTILDTREGTYLVLTLWYRNDSSSIIHEQDNLEESNI